jgi:hypothetical protein
MYSVNGVSSGNSRYAHRLRGGTAIQEVGGEVFDPLRRDTLQRS